MTKVEKKQFILFGLMVLALLFLGCQIYQLMRHDFQLTPASLTMPVPTASVERSVSSADQTQQLLNEQTSISAAQQQIAAIQLKMQQFMNGSGLAEGHNISSDIYRLSYMNQLNGQWSAMLVKKDTNIQVVVGTQLPDGSKIISISEKGVLLQKDVSRELLTFKGIIALQVMPNIAATTAKIFPSIIQSSAIFPLCLLPKLSLMPAPESTSVAITEHGGPRYAVQLGASANLAKLQKWMSRYHLQSSKVIKLTHKHRDWYLWVAGDYSSLQQAEQAFKKLPQQFKSQGAWIRKYTA